MAGTSQLSSTFEVTIKQTGPAAQENLTTGNLNRGGIVIGALVECYSLVNGAELQLFKRSSAGVDTSISLGGAKSGPLQSAPYNLAANKATWICTNASLATCTFVAGDSLKIDVTDQNAQLKVTFLCISSDALALPVTATVP